MNFKLLLVSPKVTLIFKKTVTMKDIEGKLPLALKRPGSYRWEISSVADPETPIASANFVVLPRYEALQVNGVTVGGTKASSSQLTGTVLKNFDLTFSWQPYSARINTSFRFFLHLRAERASGFVRSTARFTR